jgi:hypothetical protein
MHTYDGPQMDQNEKIPEAKNKKKKFESTTKIDLRQSSSLCIERFCAITRNIKERRFLRKKTFDRR